MSFKSWILKEEEEKQVVPQKTPVFSPSTVKTDKSVFSPNPAPTYSSVPDEKFVSMLEQVIMDNNIPGLDYIEFKKAVDKMSNLPIDESTKILTAFSILNHKVVLKMYY